MFIIDSIVDSVKTTLISGFSELDSLVKVKLAYEKNAIPNPLKKAYVVLSPEKITVVPYRTDDPLVTKQVTYKLSINIHCPESANPQRLLEIFNYTVIILDDSNLYDIEEAECGEIKTDANTNSVFLPCTVLFTQYC